MKYLIAVTFMICNLILAPITMRSALQNRETPSIQGRVLYPDGKIARGALVSAFRKGQMTGRILTGHSDNEGRFVINRVQIGAEYSLCASKPDDGYLDPYMLPFGLSTGGHCKDITAGDALDVDVVLAPKSGALEGQVRDAKRRWAIHNGKVVVYRPLKFLRGEWTLVNPREATW